eukprot:1899572-Pyramimonas_sp.AAC.1
MYRDAVFRDVTSRGHHRRSGHSTTVLRRDCCLGTGEGQIHVVGANLIYDTMLEEGSASAEDRRAASDLAIIREALEQASCKVRWIPHGRLPVDALAKDDVTHCNLTLFGLMTRG